MQQHYRATLKLGFPIAVGQLGTIILAFADTMMVGRYGTPELAASSFVNGLFNLATMIVLGYSYGLTPIVAAAEGRGEKAAAGWALRNGALANFAFGTLLLAAFALLYAFLPHLGQPAELLPLIRPYFWTVWASMWFVLGFGILRQFADGVGRPPLSMWLLILGNALNIVLNYCLIFGHAGFPELGLLGAGFATLTSRAFMALLLLLIVWGSSSFAPYRRWKSTASLSLRRIHAQSWPVAVQMGLEAFAFSISALMAGWLGALPLAVYQVLIAVGHLGFLLYYSFGAALSIRVAHFLGQNDTLQARRAGVAGRNVLLCAALLVALIFVCGDRVLISQFSSDPQVVAVSLLVVPYLAAYQWADAMQVCYANALRATGRVGSMTWVALLAYLVVGFPVSYLLAFILGLGLEGLFLSFSVSLLLAAVLFRRYYHRALRLN